MIKESLIGQLNIRLSTIKSQPDGPPKAVAIVAHGYAEHMGRYHHVIEALNQHNYVVFMLDHRGHGESEGPRACVEKFDYFVEDLHLLVQKAQRAYPDLPLFMVAHSMGGLIGTAYAIGYQSYLDGLVLSGPALHVGDDVPTFLKTISKYLAKFVPNLGLLPKEDGVLSRDPDVERRFRADPLCYNGKMKARMGYELMIAAQQACDKMAQLSLPLLIMHGSVDKLTNPSGSKQLYAEAQSTDKTLKLWPDYFHEIFNDVGKEEVLAFMLEWLDERVRQKVVA